MRQPERLELDLRAETPTCSVATVDEKRGSHDYSIVDG